MALTSSDVIGRKQQTSVSSIYDLYSAYDVHICMSMKALECCYWFKFNQLTEISSGGQNITILTLIGFQEQQCILM